ALIKKDCASQVRQDIFALIQSLLSPTRKLICQGNVVLQTGLQTQERFLILFNDLLIITKAKSVMQVKQKKCVRVHEMWTASCVDEVCEANTASERSFVMGWPTYNCVATFSTSEEKDRWLPLIESCIQEEKKSDDPKMIPLKIFAKDVGNCAYAKTLFISNTDCTSDVISTALQQFGLSGGIKDYKLWVCSKQDETPYPLIGKSLSYCNQTTCFFVFLKNMLKCLCSEGAVTRGIFRRSAGVKACRELREKLDSGHYEESLSGEPVLVTASVFKEFLRNIPGSLLCEELYEQWLQAVELVQRLPKENLLLLRHMIVMLHHIQLNAEHNQMTSFNLAVCIAPSCLWNLKLQSHEKDAKKVSVHALLLLDYYNIFYSEYISFLFLPLVGSLQQMSDSGYESLKNEVNTDTEDISKACPLKDSRSMDSLMSLSDCDLDCPENDVLSSSPLAQIRNCTSAVRQLRSLKLHRHSISTIALTSHEQEITIESGKHEEFKRPDEVNDNVFLDQTFQQLNFMRVKQTPPTSNVSSPVTSPISSPVSSIDGPFVPSTRKALHSPQDSPAKVDLLTQNGTDYQHSDNLPNEKLSPPNNQRNFTDIKVGLQPKMPQNPQSNQQALKKLNRKPFSRTPTQTYLHKRKGLFFKGPGSPMHSPLGDPKVSPDPQTIRFTCQTRTEEEVRLPQSVFYGQSCKLTVHKIRGQNAGLKSTKLSGQQLRFKALDFHPSSGKIVRDYFMDASPLREEQAVGRSQKLSCCSRSQWIV
uniref:Rho GTPase activating protein 20 n=1 Tax=Cyprinus carpio TaxID=7962 RepID=A0A8C1V207_CYPCA